MNFEEFNIPMPWGHIAVKAWGHSSNKPVLVTHGRMDNAGSFDGLIPLLAESFYYICIDLPSHGKSSHIPPFFPIHSLDFVMVYKLVFDYFNRGKYILLGHSYGAAIGQYFARFYPEYVEKIIGIDCVTLHNVEPKEFKQFAVEQYKALLEIYQKEKTGKKPAYTKEKIIEKLRNNRLNEPLSIKAASSIAERLLQPAGNGKYYISTDQRMKVYFDPLQDFNHIMETFRLFTIACPYLLIMATRSPHIITDMNPILKEIEKWENAKIVFVDFGHDVHIIHPETVAPFINDFLLKSQSKL